MSARVAYRKTGVEEKFKLLIQPNVGHTVTAESRAVARKWFARWLKP